MELFHSMTNGKIEGFCLIKTVEKKTSVRGTEYLDLILADSGGEVSAKLWDYQPAAHSGLKADMLVKVRGVLEKWKDKDQLKVELIRQAAVSDTVKMEDFVPHAPYEGEWMYGQILSEISGWENQPLKILVTDILESHKEKLCYFPAALKLHHAYRAGLLYHTLSVLRLAQQICNVYTFVDRELLYAGIILHDIAKVQELEVGDTGIAADYTTEGTLIGHLVKGAMNIETAGVRLGIPRELLTLLEHMVLSHHGEPEFGAAVRPMFLEAELLSQLDNLDATVFEMMSAVDGVELGRFSPRQWALDQRKIYNYRQKEIQPAKLD